ncbi:DUF1801 domain-containing protein [Parasphingopyxis sp.]|uniref:DUF1801 domain-containing protein n=1 Tax=Parasphingopyxis sp. TaxID=1920299 RepID=UPI00261B85E9|nr:DUF1801 domain-containing protein [Parasphingopyxis sp.]
MATPGFQSEAVEARFGEYDDAMRKRLLELRALILDTAAETDGVGPLEETLKWNEPAYLNPAGTTIRLNAHKGSDREIGLYVHCQTDLAERFRQLYGDQLRIDGNRAILIDIAQPLPRDALRHCIAMALTYRRR